MIRIIDRKSYDTEEAEAIAQFMPNAALGAVPNWRETLYKRDDDEMEPSSELIESVTEEKAVDWCENREVDGEIVLGEFDHLIET